MFLASIVNWMSKVGHKHPLSILVILLILTSCSKAKVQPVSPLQAPSPLSAPMAPRLGDGPAPSIEKVQQRGATWGPNQLYLPFVMETTVRPCYMDEQAVRLFNIFVKDPEQTRKNITCNSKLVQAAQHRVSDMNERRYFNHFDPEGRGPNFWAEYFGCHLPDYYPDNGNSIESIALNYPTVEETWAAFMKSESHRVHLRGQHEAYKRQTHVGIAVLNGQYGLLYAILTAEPC